MLNHEAISTMVAASLAEDLGDGDISAQLLPVDLTLKARIISREEAVICGIPWVNEVFKQINPLIELQWKVQDGERVQPNQILVIITGLAQSIVSAERCALNWLQTLSATATQTAQFVELIKTTKAKLFDTRKTMPGLRYAQKYAVRRGGGNNHRMGLYDAYLIKENHIISCGSITAAVNLARTKHPNRLIEIEVENLNELQEALRVKADIVLLDNFKLEEMNEAVLLNQNQVELEVSGNVDLNTIQEIAKTGVDRISVGALTKHVRAIDLSLRFFTD